jgi:hypothetical protein
MEAMNSQAKLTKVGHTLCIGQVAIPQANQPGNSFQWVWWIRDPTGAMVGEKHTLCYDLLDDLEIYKAYSEAVYRLSGKVQEIIEFDELEWSP